MAKLAMFVSLVAVAYAEVSAHNTTFVVPPNSVVNRSPTPVAVALLMNSVVVRRPVVLRRARILRAIPQFIGTIQSDRHSSALLPDLRQEFPNHPRDIAFGPRDC